MNKRFFTQWTAQFFVAAELSRRGYLIAFTLGNAPQTDIIVTSPKSKSFRVECKGLRSRSTWLYKCDDEHENHFYIFTYIPKLGNPSYYILSHNEAKSISDNYIDKHPSQKRTKDWPGCNWSDIAKVEFEDRWDKLPE